MARAAQHERDTTCSPENSCMGLLLVAFVLGMGCIPRSWRNMELYTYIGLVMRK